MLVISEILSHLVSKPSQTLIWRGFGAWQNGDKHVTNRIEMWQNFRHMLETAQPRGFWGFVFCHIFVPDVTNFVTIVWYIKVNVTYLTEIAFLLWQKLSPVCHILYVLWQILSNFCPQFVTSHPCYDKFCPIFVPSLSHFLDFYTFFMHKMYILAFCPIFVTFFVTWDKFCHFFDTSETQ